MMPFVLELLMHAVVTIAVVLIFVRGSKKRD